MLLFGRDSTTPCTPSYKSRRGTQRTSQANAKRAYSHKLRNVYPNTGDGHCLRMPLNMISSTYTSAPDEVIRIVVVPTGIDAPNECSVVFSCS